MKHMGLFRTNFFMFIRFYILTSVTNQSAVFWRFVVWYYYFDISEERIASIFMAEE